LCTNFNINVTPQYDSLIFLVWSLVGLSCPLHIY
jgi:hypothetical protein